MLSVLKCLKCIDEPNEITLTPYEQLWQKHYVVDQIADDEYKLISENINLKIETLNKCRDLSAKQLLICNLYKYLASEGYPILSNEVYKNLLIDRTFEFYESDNQVFKMMDKDTKKFVYALSGIK